MQVADYTRKQIKINYKIMITLLKFNIIYNALSVNVGAGGESEGVGGGVGRERRDTFNTETINIMW